MGIFNFFRNRQARESALAAPDQRAPVQVTQTEGISGGLAGLGTLISQLQAMQDAGVTVESSKQVLDLRGTDLREDILGVIAAHGIDPTKDGQEIDASSVAGLQGDILAVLSQAGIDVAGAGMPGMPAAGGGVPAEPEPIDPTVPQIRNPLGP